MSFRRTIPGLFPVLAALLASSAPCFAQRTQEWRTVGNAAVDLALAGPATGPVERVWYSSDGSKLFLRTRAGLIYETDDFEHWRRSEAIAPLVSTITVARLPELNAKAISHPRAQNEAFAVGSGLYRSEDKGANWTDLTGRKSPLGRGLADVAVSPLDAKDLAVAGSCGVWRSLDGGATWNSLNQDLPNLPVRRLRRTPSGVKGMQTVLQGMSIDGLAAETPFLAEWAPGEKAAWRPAQDASWQTEEDRKRALTQSLGIQISVTASSGDLLYAGSPEGWIFVSRDSGRSWRSPYAAGVGIGVTDLWADPKDPLVAIVTLTSRSSDSIRTRVVRTADGGATWSDLTGNLPEGNLRGVTADHATGAIYVAGDAGVFLSYNEQGGPVWTALSSKAPGTPAVDVKLDAAGNQLYVALAGQGVFATLAPHRWLDPKVVSAADLNARPAAPGSLLSILGSESKVVQSGGQSLSILSSAGEHVEVQVPFEAAGESLRLAFEGLRGPVSVGIPLQRTSPAIFTDRNGTPLLLNADTGAFLDAGAPAHPGTRLQILMTGLGRVTPDWPTGQAAPLENAPAVVAPVRVFLDRTPLEITKATLAPGYIGFYLVEVALPAILNAGPAELYVEADSASSNRVRLYVEQN